MTAQSRLTKSMLFGALAGGALTWFEATKRHAALAAAVARPMAHGQHMSQATILAVGFAVTTLAVGVLTFVLATIVTIRARRRLLLRARSVHRGYGGYDDYGGGW